MLLLGGETILRDGDRESYPSQTGIWILRDDRWRRMGELKKVFEIHI